MSKASDLARLLTSGSTSLHGEAGVTASGSTGLTTNLQQGLAKAWSAVASDGASFEDSFNTSSHTDTSTGLGTVNLSNSFTNTSYVCKGITRYLYNSLDGAKVISIGARNTNSYSLQAGYLDSSARYVAEDRTRMASAHGDLA